MKRITIIVSLLFAFFITGCEEQNEKVLNTEEHSIRTDNTTTQTEKSSSKKVAVTLQVKDNHGNLVPNVGIRVNNAIFNEIGLVPDEDGMQTLNLEANFKHKVKVIFGDSKEVIKEFTVQDHPMTFDILKPE
jgi:hypothetical protein